MARRIGIVALSLILFEGGLAAGWSEIRPVFGRPLSLAVVGHDRHRRDRRPRRGRAVRPLDARGAAARLDPRLHGRRGDLRGAARLDAAPPARADARGRGGLQRPGCRRARARVHRVDHPPATTAWSTWRCCSSARSGSGSRRRCRRRARRGRRSAACSSPSAGLYPVASLPFGALAFGGADVAARLGLPRRVHHRARDRAARRRPRNARSPRFHDGLAWVGPARAVPRRSACWCSRQQLGDVAVEGTLLALIVALRGAAGRDLRGDGRLQRFTLPETSGARLGGAARRRPGGARHLPGDRRRRRTATSSSTSSSSRCWSRRSCRARRSSRSRDGSA